jgi:hypothetical protein
MRKNTSIFKIILIVILATTYYLLATNYSYAQQAVNMTVVPPQQDISANPGEETRIQIKFLNKTDEPISGYIKKADFLVLDKEGTPTLFDSSAANNRFTASSWLTPSEDKVTIAANNQYISTVYIKVPKDAYPCGHYASIYFEPVAPSLGGQEIKMESASSVAFRLSSLIYFNIKGVCRENAYVSKITASQFLEYGPIKVDLDILNRSDYYVTPQVALQSINMLNNPVTTQVLPLKNIFPDMMRNYSADLGSKWMIGRYKIALSGGYGKMGKSLTAYTYVWVFPWRFAIIILLALLVIILVGKSIIDQMNKKSNILEHEIAEEKAEIEKLREALKKRSD